MILRATLPPVVSFVAPSGTGKTTLIEGLIRVFVTRGLRVGVVKHDAHRVELDKPGKDSWRFRRAGAFRVALVGDEQLAVFSGLDGPVPVLGVVARAFPGADLVLTEGFRRSSLPMIRVHRSAVDDPSWEPPAAPIAWISDAPRVARGVPVLPLDAPEAAADFITERLLAPVEASPRTTLAFSLGSAADPSAVRAAAARLGGLVTETLVVRSPGAPAVDGLRTVHDVRPGAGPLGTVITALVAARTERVLLLDGLHHTAPEALVRSMCAAAPLADVVVPERWGSPGIGPARYGHRCLPAIHAALISGEERVDGWWGQVRVARVPGVR